MNNELQARELENLSTALINFGVKTVKRNPIKFSLYVVGAFLCFFFNGLSVSSENLTNYNYKLSTVDFHLVQSAAEDVNYNYQKYYNLKGWFTCNKACQEAKFIYDSSLVRYNLAKANEDSKLREAKENLGIFSEYGVADTRDMFWYMFSNLRNHTPTHISFV